jgi:farnesyl-diphosphate farnesyltransferase
MLSLGVQYGKGLQLINILRDVGADLRGGRCYLPAEQLQAAGVSPEEIATRPAAIEAVLRTWQDSAGEGLQAGVDYACSIRPWRVRLATALPALIGARTLALLRTAGATVITNRPKFRAPKSGKFSCRLWRTSPHLRPCAGPSTARAAAK